MPTPMPVPVTIRIPRIGDAAAMVDLLNPIIAEGIHTVMTEPVTVASQVAFIQSFPDRGIFHVAFAEDRRTLVGLQDIQPISDEPGQAHVGVISTFVASTARRCGIGRSLLNATIAAAIPRGYRKLLATVRTDNHAALTFYRNTNFTDIGLARRHARIAGTYVDAIMTERWLNE